MERFWNAIAIYIYMIPVLLSLPFHEFAHGYVSYKLGDPTAKNQGRLTLNPLKHLDPLGTLMMFIARIGWAKPVPVNASYYKNKKMGMFLVALAGPMSNIILSFAFSLFYVILFYTAGGPSMQGFTATLGEIFALFMQVNIYLAIFNLLPLPPLDGSKILGGLLPEKQYWTLMQHERTIGIVFLILILFFSTQFAIVLRTLANPVVMFFLRVSEAIVRFFM